MRITHIKSGEFCYICGKEIDMVYRMNIGTSGTYSSEFDLCEKCMKKLHKQIGKALDRRAEK